QVHKDVVVCEDAIEYIEANNTHYIHNIYNEHHKSENKEDSNREHHHHCTVINLSLTFFPIENNFHFISITTKKREINFNQNTYYSLYLGRIFQPPRV
ncbi:MAG: hypothetical protein ACWIPI_08165, partial [Polaribacter sp.]